MKQYQNKKRIAGLILLVAVILAQGISGKGTADVRQPEIYAWWGTIYPEFCFGDGTENGENRPVKISFWLAKALDW